MAHTIKEKKKLLHRARRIRGQVEAIERALEEEQECSVILQTIAACRGAINGLMAELIKDHISHHVFDIRRKSTPAQHGAARELIEVVNRYFK